MGACALEGSAAPRDRPQTRFCGAHLGLGLLELLGKVGVLGRNLGGILGVGGLALAVDGGQVLLLKAALCEARPAVLTRHEIVEHRATQPYSSVAPPAWEARTGLVAHC